MPPDVMYWIYAFPAIVLSVTGADFVASSGTLFIAKVALPHEQSVAGALFSMMTQIGTAVGVTVSMMVFNGVAENAIIDGKDPIIVYRAVQWTAFGFGVVGKLCFLLCGSVFETVILASVLSIAAFRGVGVVGVDSPPKTVTDISLSSLEEAGKVQEK